MLSSPRELIGVVGHPTHGKTTSLKIIQQLTGAVVFDTGEPLRRACMDLYNLTWEDVSTQEGKAKLVYRPEHRDRVTVRQALGDYGKVREAQSDDKNIWTTISVEQAQASLFPVLAFDSVRMGQGEVIQREGGIVLEIRDVNKPNSPHDFDQIDPRFTDFVVSNVSTLEKLEFNIRFALAYLRPDRWGHLAA
jgi:hypothetical protein